MKVDHTKSSQFGPFQILPTTGKKIIQQFIDYETKLLIIQEIAITKKAGNFSQLILLTTLNPTKGTIISPKDRPDYIDYATKVTVAKDLPVKSVVQRVVNLQTGNESFEYTIRDLLTNKILVSGSAIAFSKKQLVSPLEKYQKQLSKNKEREEFWAVTYPAKSYEERVKYWGNTLHQLMRWQTESGYEEASIFSKQWLEENQKVEPQLLQIIEELLETWDFYWDILAIRAALRQ